MPKQKSCLKYVSSLKTLIMVLVISVIVFSMDAAVPAFADTVPNSDICTDMESKTPLANMLNLPAININTNNMYAKPIVKDSTGSPMGSGAAVDANGLKMNLTQTKQQPLRNEALGQNNTISLPYNVTDSAINPDQPLIYISSMDDKKLYEVNYETGSQREITFDLPPERIFYANGKIYVCLLKGQHDYFCRESNQKGAFSIVDASTFTKIYQFDIQFDPYDIVADNNGNVYISGGSGQWTNIVSYKETTGAMISKSSIYQCQTIEINTKYNKIYVFSNGYISPQSFRVYTYTPDGLLRNANTGGPTSYNTHSSGFKISPDDTFIFDGSGNILICNNKHQKDMKLFFNTENGFDSIAFDLQNNRYFTSYSYLNKINEYSYNCFENTGTCSTIGKVKSLYYGNILLAITVDSSNKYRIEKIPDSNIASVPQQNIKPVPSLNEYGIDLGTSAKRTIYDNISNKSYSISENSNSLIVADLNTRKVINTILLPYKPVDLCISEDKTKIFIANCGTEWPITVLDINTGSVLKNLNYAVEKDYYDETVHRHIYNKGGKIYYIDGEWTPKTYIFDSATLEYITSPFDKVGDIAFSNNNTYLYYWHQIGWSVGNMSSNVYKYSITGNTYELSGITSTDLACNPLDTPILLLDSKNAFICKEYMFMNNNLSSPILTFPEPIYAVSEEKSIAVGRNGIYDLNTGSKKVTADFSRAQSFFFDKNGVLFFVRDDILVPYEVSDITPNYIQRVMVPGDSFQTQITLHYSDGTSQDISSNAVYTSDDPTIAQVSDTGVITAMKYGETHINAKYGNNITSIRIIVRKPLPPVIAYPKDGLYTKDNIIEVTGIAFPNSKVYVNFEDDSWRAATTDSNGNWSYKPNTILKDGTYSISAKIVDQYGNESDATTPINVVVDTKSPDPPVISAPSNGMSIKSQNLIVFGYSEPYSRIDFYINSYKYADYVVDQYGFFRVLLISSLPQGTYTLTLRAEDRAGNISVMSSPVDVTVNPSANSSVVIGTPVNNTVIKYKLIVFSGLTDPNTLVKLYDNNILIASTTSDEIGYWGVIPENLFKDGSHTLYASITVNGNVLFSNTVSITVNTYVPVPVVNSPVSGTKSNNSAITITGKARAFATVYVVVENTGTAKKSIYIVHADIGGLWSCTLNGLADGKYKFSAMMVDNYNNLSAESSPVDYTIDTVKPVLALNGPEKVIIKKGNTYVDNGATAKDNNDADISSKIVVSGGAVDTNTTGTYTITYEVQDTAGNYALPIKRIVIVTSTTGDLDGDDKITESDIDTVKDFLIGKTSSKELNGILNGDIDGDGKITSNDYVLLKRKNIKK